jgi:hypothetical protein
MRVEPTRSYSSNSRRPVRSVGIWPSLAKKLLLLSRLVSGHLTTATTPGLERLPPVQFQSITPPNPNEPNLVSTKRRICRSACLPACLPTFTILPFFSSFSWRYLAGCEDAEDTRYPKIDTRQRLARHWLMFGFGVRYPVPVPD